MSFRTMTLEDGEVVTRLRRGTRLKHAGWKSDLPHAGHWGRDTDYVLVPCSQPARRARVAVSAFPGLENRSSDAEVLLLGPPAVIEKLVTEGPPWCRALVKREVSPEQRARLIEHLIRAPRQADRERLPSGNPSHEE